MNADKLKSAAPRFGPRAADFLAIFVLFAAVLIVFGELLFGTGARVASDAGGDLPNQFLAWRHFAFTELARGHLPLWNPHVFGGAPFLGGFQSALLYPPNWLYMILPLGSAVNVDVALHVLLAGLWTFCWARRRGFHPLAAVAGGMVFMFGGAHFLHVWAGHLSNLCTMAWAPLLFLAIDEITTTNSRWNVWRGAWIGAGALALQILAGHPQYVYYTAIIAGAYACLGLIRAPRRMSALAALLALAGAGAALAAGQLLAGLEATAESVRSTLDYETAKTFAFPPENLVTLVAPDLLGDLSDVLNGAHYWGRWVLWENSLFIGVTAFALALYGALRAERRARRFSVVMIGLALLLALGFYTPLYRVLYLYLPGFGSFRGVSKFMFLAGLFLSMLTAAGVDRLLRERATSAWPAAILLMAAAVLMGLGAAVWNSADHGRQGWWVRAMSAIDFKDPQHWWKPWTFDSPPPRVLLGFFVKCGVHAAQSLLWCGGTCVLVAGTGWLASRRRGAVYGLVFLSCIELCVFASVNRGTFELRRFQAYCALLQKQLAAISADARVIGAAPGATMMAGGSTIAGDDPMVLHRYAEFADWAKTRAAAGQWSPAWGMFRLQYQLDGDLNHPRRLPWQALARAQLVRHYIVAPDARATFALMENPDFDPRETVLLEAPVEFVPASNDRSAVSSKPAPDDAGSVEVRELSTDEIDIRATTSRPAILLITDNYSTGWQVRSLDPTPPQPHYELVPGDHALRAIPLAAGTHHLRIEYRPWGWTIGRWISLGALVIYAGWGLTVVRMRRSFVCERQLPVRDHASS